MSETYISAREKDPRRAERMHIRHRIYRIWDPVTQMSASSASRILHSVSPYARIPALLSHSIVTRRHIYFGTRPEQPQPSPRAGRSAEQSFREPMSVPAPPPAVLRVEKSRMERLLRRTLRHRIEEHADPECLASDVGYSSLLLRYGKPANQARTNVTTTPRHAERRPRVRIVRGNVARGKRWNEAVFVCSLLPEPRDRTQD